MPAYRLEKTLTEDGALQLDSLPFQKGDTVEVILLKRQPEPNSTQATSLKGSVLRYNNPTDPVALEDWEASR